MFSCALCERGASEHILDGLQITQKALAHRTFECGIIKGGKQAHTLITLLLSQIIQNHRAVTQLRRKRIWENGRRVRGKTNQRGQPSKRHLGKIDEQVACCRRLCTSLPDGGFPLCQWPAFSKTLDDFLHTGCFSPGPNDL